MTKDMIRWLKQYEQLRTNPHEPNESWKSTKYDIEGMNWTEISEIYIPELNMDWGTACSALRKSWYRYKQEKRESSGHYMDLQYRIKKIQRSLGIPETVFKDQNNEYIEDELSREEKEAMSDELEEGEGEFNIETGAQNPEEEDEDDFGEWEGL